MSRIPLLTATLNPILFASRAKYENLWERYCQERIREGYVKCSLSKYKSVFYKYFNIGFRNPRSDTCSTCAGYLIQIKATNDLDEKNRLRTECRLHKIRAKKFYEMLKVGDDNTITICFDCQQNQPLLKLSVGEIFYSRQVWLYNCTIPTFEKDNNLENVSLYMA